MLPGDEEIAAGLSPGMRRAVLIGFARPFWSNAEHGMWREWPDICFMTGQRRSYRNTIVPLIARGLAERNAQGFCRLTSAGLRVRTILESME